MNDAKMTVMATAMGAWNLTQPSACAGTPTARRESGLEHSPKCRRDVQERARSTLRTEKKLRREGAGRGPAERDGRQEDEEDSEPEEPQRPLPLLVHGRDGAAHRAVAAADRELRAEDHRPVFGQRVSGPGGPFLAGLRRRIMADGSRSVLADPRAGVRGEYRRDSGIPFRRRRRCPGVAAGAPWPRRRPPAAPPRRLGRAGDPPGSVDFGRRGRGRPSARAVWRKDGPRARAGVAPGRNGHSQDVAADGKRHESVEDVELADRHVLLVLLDPIGQHGQRREAEACVVVARAFFFLFGAGANPRGTPPASRAPRSCP